LRWEDEIQTAYRAVTFRAEAADKYALELLRGYGVSAEGVSLEIGKRFSVSYDSEC